MTYLAETRPDSLTKEILESGKINYYVDLLKTLSLLNRDQNKNMLEWVLTHQQNDRVRNIQKQIAIGKQITSLRDKYNKHGDDEKKQAKNPQSKMEK